MISNPSARKEAGPLVQHPEIGAKVRSGGYLDHAASSYALCKTALREGRFADAAELARYTVTEALEAYELFTAWCGEIPDFIAARGIAAKTIAAESERLERLWGGGDGKAFNATTGWKLYTTLIETFAADAEAGRARDEMLDDAREVWRDTHD